MKLSMFLQKNSNNYMIFKIRLIWITIMHIVSFKMIYKETTIMFFTRFILIYFIAFQERRALWHDWKILT